jgi:hypothetical protein
MLSDKSKKGNEVDNTVPFISTKIHEAQSKIYI